MLKVMMIRIQSMQLSYQKCHHLDTSNVELCGRMWQSRDTTTEVTAFKSATKIVASFIARAEGRDEKEFIILIFFLDVGHYSNYNDDKTGNVEKDE